HVSIVRIQSRRAPAHVPNVMEGWVIRVKARLFNKRIGAEPRAQLLNPDWLIRSLDVQLQVTPRTPHQWRKLCGGLASGQKFVCHANDMFALNFVAVSLLAFVVNERFRVSYA